MSDTALTPQPEPDLPAALRAALDRTPARVLVGRAGPGYRTETWLKLREDHAAARDAVHAELDLMSAFGEERIGSYLLFEARTRARTKAEFLMRPDLGRQLDDESRERIAAQCPTGRDFQVFVGDGLSATAAAVQAPLLLDLLLAEANVRGWSFGRPFVVRHCRVGVLNDVGDLLRPAVAVLLIGERPGLAAADSLSAYLAYRPRAGHTDADRNLISNIHARGVPVPDAARRIGALAAKLMAAGVGGVTVKEDLPAALPPPQDRRNAVERQ